MITTYKQYTISYQSAINIDIIDYIHTLITLHFFLYGTVR